MNLILVIGLNLMALVFLIGGLTKLSATEADFTEAQVENYQVFITKYDKYSKKIVVKDKDDEYSLYSPLLNDYPSLEQVKKDLERSSIATIWYEGNGWVRGIKTAHFTIPTSKGIEVQHDDGRWALGYSFIFFLCSLAYYFYVRFKFGKDWIVGANSPKYRKQRSEDEFTKLDL